MNTGRNPVATVTRALRAQPLFGDAKDAKFAKDAKESDDGCRGSNDRALLPSFASFLLNFASFASNAFPARLTCRGTNVEPHEKTEQT